MSECWMSTGWVLETSITLAVNLTINEDKSEEKFKN